MRFQKSIMRIDIKINTDFFLEGSIQFLLEIINEFWHPTIIFIIFLSIAEEDVVLKAFNNACYSRIIMFSIKNKVLLSQMQNIYSSGSKYQIRTQKSVIISVMFLNKSDISNLLSTRKRSKLALNKHKQEYLLPIRI